MKRSPLASMLLALLLLGCGQQETGPLDGPVTETLDPADEARWRTISAGCASSFERVGLVPEDVVASTSVTFDDVDVSCGWGAGVFVRGHEGSAYVCSLLVLAGPPLGDGDAEPPDDAETSLEIGRLDLETGEITGLASDGGWFDMDPATVTIEADGETIRCAAEGAGHELAATIQDPDPAPGTAGLVTEVSSFLSELALSPVE